MYAPLQTSVCFADFREFRSFGCFFFFGKIVLIFMDFPIKIHEIYMELSSKFSI